MSKEYLEFGTKITEIKVTEIVAPQLMAWNLKFTKFEAT